MSQMNGQNNERMEQLLRRWGAEEAVSQWPATPAPLLPPLPVGRLSWPARWLPTAAALIFMVTGVWLYIASTSPAPVGSNAPHGQAQAPDGREQLDRALADLAETQRLLETWKQAFAAEATRLRQSAESALAARQDVEKKLAAIEARQAATVGLIQQVHLAAATPGEKGILTLQAAARENHLLSRGAELRDRLANQAVRRLFDTQETFLSQLDLLDPGNRNELETFADRVRSLDLGPQIDEAIRGGADPGVTQWLIETQLILSGVRRAS